MMFKKENGQLGQKPDILMRSLFVILVVGITAIAIMIADGITSKPITVQTTIMEKMSYEYESDKNFFNSKDKAEPKYYALCMVRNPSYHNYISTPIRFDKKSYNVIDRDDKFNLNARQGGIVKFLYIKRTIHKVVKWKLIVLSQ